MCEHQVVVVLVGRALEVAFEFASYAIRQGNRPRTAAALGRSPVTANEVLPDPNTTRYPVDIAPAQAEQLTLPEAGHGGSEVQHSVGRPERVIVGHGPQKRLYLLHIEEANVGVLLDPRSVHFFAGVGPTPLS